MIDVVIDIYHGETPVNFEELKAGGILGVIHKATEGRSVVDDRYAARKQMAASTGMLWGAYHFLRPGDLRAQAAHFIEIAGADVDIYAADHEDARVSLNDLKVFLRECCRLTGKQQLVVYSGHVIKEQLGGRHDEELAKHRLWLAQYTSGTPSWPTGTWPDWWLHQYTETGHVPGYDGEVDRNRYDGTEEELFRDWTGSEQPEPAPEPEPDVATVDIVTTGNVVISVNGKIV